MNKQIKRLLLTELSSKRKLAKSLYGDLPVSVTRTRSKTNDSVKSFYMLIFDERNILFHFDTWVKSDDVTFYLKETETYAIGDLKQELKLSESWFVPFNYK